MPAERQPEPEGRQGRAPAGGGAPSAELHWAGVPTAFRRSDGELPTPWQAIFGPLRRGRVDDLVLVGQCGQSIDARIATATGHSHYINGAAGLAHLHRLRALVDAVVVGVGTAIADDPQLTVRRVEGPNPARVVIDPKGRLPATARALTDDGTRRIVITATPTTCRFPDGVEVVPLAMADRQITPPQIVAALATRGMRRILVEGGADTVSRFLSAGCLDRLHIMVAPIILGSGRASLSLPPITRVAEALPAPMRVHPLDDEVLIDCDLAAHRVPLLGAANRST